MTKPTFLKLVSNAFTDLWLSARSHTVGRMVVITFLWGVVLISIGSLVNLLEITTVSIPFLRIATAIFFLFMAVTWAVVTIEQTKVEFRSGQTKQEIFAGIIAMIPTLLIAILLFWAVTSYSFFVLSTPVKPLVKDYVSCFDAGGTVLQTSPRECLYGTETFVE